MKSRCAFGYRLLSMERRPIVKGPSRQQFQTYTSILVPLGPRSPAEMQEAADKFSAAWRSVGVGGGQIRDVLV